MKNLSASFFLAAALAVAISGCARKPTPITPIPDLSGPQIGMADDPTGLQDGNLPPGDTLGNQNDVPGSHVWPGDTTMALPSDELINNMAADREAFSQQTVYFDFDRATIRPSEESKIEAVATFLKNEPMTYVQVEGHCDERGTEEYNRSLGERRAIAVREYLINLGISNERVFTISYGEDLPAVMGMDESAYAKNRRGEFVLLRPRQ